MTGKRTLSLEANIILLGKCTLNYNGLAHLNYNGLAHRLSVIRLRWLPSHSRRNGSKEQDLASLQRMSIALT